MALKTPDVGSAASPAAVVARGAQRQVSKAAQPTPKNPRLPIASAPVASSSQSAPRNSTQSAAGPAVPTATKRVLQKSVVKQPASAKSSLNSTVAMPAVVAVDPVPVQTPVALEALLPEAAMVVETSAAADVPPSSGPDLIEAALEATPIAISERFASESVAPELVGAASEMLAEAAVPALPEAVCAETVMPEMPPAIDPVAPVSPAPIMAATPRYTFSVLLKSCELWSTAFGEASRIAAESVRLQFETNQALWKAAQDVRSVRDVVDLTSLLARSRSEAMAENGRQVFALIQLIEQSWSPMSARLTKAA